ncbi:MAG: DUF4292 domain-containing protein [Candidatus Stahlbacteria bacterium]|nr:DUF4292 domain-containing protein [Candidatus Stahlbacteria bacterium]
MWLYIVLGCGMGELNSNYSLIHTLQGEVTKSFSTAKTTHTTITKFYLKPPNKLLIKCAKPEQTIILNDSVLWVYFPLDKRAMKKNYTELSDLEKQILGMESFLGLNPIRGLEGAYEFESQDNSTIVAKPKTKANIMSKVVFAVDTLRKVILRGKIFDLKDSLLSSTNYENWQKIDSVWLPQKVISEIYVGGEKLKEEQSFQYLKVNGEIDEQQFNFTPPEGVKIFEEKKGR